MYYAWIVLLNCVQPTKELLYGDIPDLDVRRAIEIAQGRESGRKLDLRNVANLSMRTLQIKKKIQ